MTVTRAVNAVPTFTDGVSTSRDFNETYADTSVLTASNIRTPVVATDTDADRLSYSLEGTDAARFGILPTDGQLQTKAGENYDYEAKSSYAVTVKVEDGSGGSATIAVTLNVTDRDEPPIAPDAPTVNATSGSATSLDVRWTAPSNTGRPAVTSYDLQYKKTIDSTWTDGPQSVTTTSATLTGLAAETPYEVQVRAENDEGAEAWSSEATGTTTALPAVTVSKTTLTVTEEDATGDSYTVVLDTEPTADVTVTVAGHAGTDVTLTPSAATLTFTPQNWETAQTVTVTAADDADTTNDMVTLTHSATSTDTDYDGITITGVTVTLSDNDTAQLMDVEITPGGAERVVEWTAVDNATGYKVQWKSRVESYNTTDRQATVTATSHTIPGLTNDTEYAVQVIATRTGANDGSPSAEVKGTPALPTAPGVTLTKSTLTVTEEDAAEDSCTVVLDTEPTADVTVTVAGHAGTDLTPNPSSLSFTTQNWETAQTVTVTATDDTDTTNDSVTLTHNATSTDTVYNDITIAGVAVIVNDNDTARVMGVEITPGDVELVVEWTAVDDATGYEVQWKSGAEDYNTTDRQATVTATSHTIPGLTNDTEYAVQVIATRTGANNGPPSAEVKGTPALPTTAGVTLTKSTLTVTEEDAAGDSYTVVLDTEPTADVTVTVAGHAGTDLTPNPSSLTFTPQDWETAQTVTVTAADDADTTNDSVTLTHSATSTDADYNAIAIAGVTVTVNDNDTAQVMDVEITPGDAELVVEWTAVDDATGYKVQWKSGVEDYNTGDRQATVTATSHTIPGLTNDTEYAVQVIATRTGAKDGPPSAEVKGTPTDSTNNAPPVFPLATESLNIEETLGAATVSAEADVGGAVDATDADNDTLSYSLDGLHKDRFTIVPTSGQIQTKVDQSYDHEADQFLSLMVVADDGNGGTATADVTVSLTDQNEPPLAPTALTHLQAGPTSLALAWTAPDNTGRPAITGYTAQFRTSGGNWVTQALGAGTGATITGLDASTQYDVHVRAENDEGAGAWATPGPYSTSAEAPLVSADVTMSKAALTVTRRTRRGQLHGGPRYPADGDVTVTVAGHAGTERDPDDPPTLTFTTQNWETVTVTATDDADTTNDIGRADPQRDKHGHRL